MKYIKKEGSKQQNGIPKIEAIMEKDSSLKVKLMLEYLMR